MVDSSVGNTLKQDPLKPQQQQQQQITQEQLNSVNSSFSNNSVNIMNTDNNELNSNSNIGSSNSNSNLPPMPKIEKKQSTRCIRSPLPQSISRQHNTGTNVNHHRQYVLLRDKTTNSSSNLNSPIITPDITSNPQSPQLQSQQSQVSLNPGKPRPFLRKQPSTKYVFSVDDNEDEIEEDLTREYLEGYGDALRHRFKTSIQSPSISQDVSNNNSINDSKKKELEQDVMNNLQQANKHMKQLKEIEVDSLYAHPQQPYECDDYDENNTNNNNTNTNNSSNNNNNNNNISVNTLQGNSNDIPISRKVTNDNKQSIHNNDNDLDDNDDGASVMSNESFTLKERQVAINETHPFGIRIWKPAIYKKDRSVQKEAELDIHAIPGAKPTIGYSVWFFNAIWACTFGLLLFIICTILGTITFVFSISTNPRTNDSLKYAKFYWNLGYYLFYPFGKIVILKSEENYINEDANVGSSIDEFTRWRTENQGKLFFSAPNAYSINRPESDGNIPTLVSTNEASNGNNNSNNNNKNNNINNIQNTNIVPATTEEEEIFYKKRFFGRGDWNVGRIIFYLQYYFILVPIGIIISLITWLSIFCIPMTKVLTIMASHIRRHPLALSFEDENIYYERQLKDPQSCKNEAFLILTYRSFGFHYYKYTVDGTNIFFINLIFVVIFTIADFYLFKERFNWVMPLTNSTVIFGLCLVSIIPLAYFIGQAVASISAQTSMGLGAVINAFFSTIVEVYLYCIALDQSKAKLVEGSLIGSILGGVLLLPGGSMCFGAIRRKTQRYNPASAGVSSTMLIYAILVMLSPTILYEIYGEYKVRCQECDITAGEDCKNCHFYQPSVVIDPLYINYLRPFTLICALSLFLVYCICLLFTLKTHAALIWSNPVTTKEKKSDLSPNVLPTPVSEIQSVTSFSLNDQSSTLNNRKASIQNLNSKNDSTTLQAQQTIQQPVEPSGGHDAPNWSRKKSTTLLLVATLLYAIIAEILVDCVDDVLKSIAINPKFLGLTIFALVPNTTEFVNAFSFAMHGNVALSMEIGSAYALQVCLLQIPIVVVYSVWNFTKAYTTTNGTSMLISKEFIGEWHGFPRLSQLIGLTKSSANNNQVLNPIADSIAGTFGSINTNILSLDNDKLEKIGVEKIFSLIFPHWDFIASLLGVYMFTYIYTEGKSNYFKGSILIFLYIVLISGFYFALKIDGESVNSFDMAGGRIWN